MILTSIGLEITLKMQEESLTYKNIYPKLICIINKELLLFVISAFLIVSDIIGQYHFQVRPCAFVHTYLTFTVWLNLLHFILRFIGWNKSAVLMACSSLHEHISYPHFGAFIQKSNVIGEWNENELITVRFPPSFASFSFHRICIK